MYESSSYEGNEIDHSPYIVDFRSAGWLPYDQRSVANIVTRCAPSILGREPFGRVDLEPSFLLFFMQSEKPT
jgi:hypothetical protein